jgi:hypothetical protein
LNSCITRPVIRFCRAVSTILVSISKYQRKPARVMGVPGTCGEEPPAGHRDRIGGGRRIEVREREPQRAQPPPHRAKRSQRRDPQQEREGPSHIGASNKRESTRSMGGKDARKVTARRQKAANPPRTSRRRRTWRPGAVMSHRRPFKDN